MNTIYKYPIQEDKEKECFYIEVPKYAEIISAIDIRVSPTSGFIYALVDNEQKEKVRREVVWYGTGWPVDVSKIGTFQFLGTFKQTLPHFPPMYWHVWVQKENLMDDFSFIFDKLLC